MCLSSGKEDKSSYNAIWPTTTYMHVLSSVIIIWFRHWLILWLLTIKWCFVVLHCVDIKGCLIKMFESSIYIWSQMIKSKPYLWPEIGSMGKGLNSKIYLWSSFWSSKVYFNVLKSCWSDGFCGILSNSDFIQSVWLKMTMSHMDISIE